MSDSTQSTLGGDVAPTRVGHWRANHCDVYVGRGDEGDAHLNNTQVYQRGWLGNPYKLKSYPREESIALYREDFEQRLEEDDEFRDAIRNLQGQLLGCWCRERAETSPACHADVIAEWADELGDR